MVRWHDLPVPRDSPSPNDEREQVLFPLLAAAGANTTDAASSDTPPPDSFRETVATVRESLGNMWADFLAHLPLLVIGLIVLIITWIVASVVKVALRKILQRTGMNASLKELARQMISLVVWVLGLMLVGIIVFPGLTPAKALAALGLGSVAIGFAFKDIFENFFAGILILWRFPFDPGDFIECNEIAGRVEEITIRMTMIRQVDGELVVVPNSVLFKNPVNVLTDQGRRRVTVICGVAYDEDVDESRAVIRKAVEACESVGKGPDLGQDAVQIFAQEFASSSINFEVTWWTGATPMEIRRSRDEVIAAVKRALDDADIEIPFPYRTLTFKESLAMRRVSGENGSSERDRDNKQDSSVS